MLNRFKRVLQTELIQSSFYSAIATAIRIATAFLMSKIIAIYLGPSGLGLIGQLTNFVTIMLVISGGSISNGIIKYIAEYQSTAPDKIKEVMSTGLRIVVFSGLFSAIFLLTFSEFLAKWLLVDEDYYLIFVIFGCTIILYGLNAFLLAILNGLKNYKTYNLINGIVSLLGLIISFLFIRLWEVKGALIATVTSQSVVFVFTIFLLRKQPWLKWTNFDLNIKREYLVKLSKFMLMTLVATACLPVGQMYIRTKVITTLSLADAGILESVNRISNVYLLFITTSLTTYFLPKLSELTDKTALRQEIYKSYKIIVPMVVACSGCIYLFRHIIIALLFTGDFKAAEDLLAFQLIGDVFKIASWLLTIQMVAKAMVRQYIMTEILSCGSLVALSMFFLGKFGLIGITAAYALNYVLYFILMVMLFRKMLF